MGHYVSEMGGGRTTFRELEAFRNKEKKKVEAELEKSRFKISDFQNGDMVMLRKEFNSDLNPGFAYGWEELFSNELGMGFENIREFTCAFKVCNVKKKEGRLKLKHNLSIWKTLGPSHAYFEMDYRFMSIVKKSAA